MALKIGRGAAAPSFIVMDVITAANARQAALPPDAPHVIRMEVGQPAPALPPARSPPSPPRSAPARRWATPRRSACGRCARAWCGIMRAGTA